MENSPKVPDSSKEQDYQRRGMALEANQLHGKEVPPERIGHVLMMSGETKPQSKDTSKAEIDRQRAATMSRSELLALSEEIAIDNTTLRHIYDTHLIGENGLRRLVYEHMHGGNLREALHHEILEHETAFERDPQLRHQTPFKPSRSAAKSTTKHPSLDNLLSKAGLVKLDPSKELTAPKLLTEHLAKRTALQPRQRRLLDLAFVGIILILLILVIMLAMSRG
jgi:hypothetical protein